MIDVIIADNQALTLKGVISILSDIDEINVTGIAATPGELEEMIIALKPQVIIIDHNYGHFLNAAQIIRIKEQFDFTHILILSNRQHRNEILELVNLGIKNYVFKDCSTEEIIDAIFTTARGEQFFCKSTLQVLFGNNLPPKRVDGAQLLSYRETEIVHLIAEGLANKDIAEKLYLSIHTIKTHRKNIIRKLGFTFKHASELILLLSYLNDFFI